MLHVLADNSFMLTRKAFADAAMNPTIGEI
jgi:hypothetical protein